MWCLGGRWYVAGSPSPGPRIFCRRSKTGISFMDNNCNISDLNKRCGTTIQLLERRAKREMVSPKSPLHFTVTCIVFRGVASLTVKFQSCLGMSFCRAFGTVPYRASPPITTTTNSNDTNNTQASIQIFATPMRR